MSRRSDRQIIVSDWVRRCFGDEVARSPQERALRVFEEAAELIQAEGISAEAAEKLLQHVYRKPKGEPLQELGGVQITVLAYAETRHVSAERVEIEELRRILAKPPEHFRQRQAIKAQAGVGLLPDDSGSTC